MDRTNAAGHVNHLFVAEDAAINQPPTEITADDLNAHQEELISVILGASLVLDRANNGQLLEAINKLHKIRHPVNLREPEFGLVNDGVADDHAAFAAAIATGASFIDARGLNCRISGQINVASNQILLLTGSNFNFIGDGLTVFKAVAKHDFALLGPFTVTGDGNTVGTSKAVHIEDCENWYVDRPIAKNVRGVGFYLHPGASTTARSQHGTVNNPRLDNCYVGWQDVPGTGAEYCTVVNPHITRCTITGMESGAGNIVVMGGHIVDNYQDGLSLVAGANGNHGGFHGTNINHNARYNLMASQVMNGETFDGCHFYANDNAGAGSIFLDRCKGINISGGHLDCQIYNYKDVNSGMNAIENMYCPGGYGVARRMGTNDGHDQLIIRNCFGPGVYAVAGGKDTVGISINDPSDCYVVANLDPGSYQALISGVGATLVWTGIPFPDRRGAYNAATGEFTAPKGGLFRFSFDALFNGTAVDSTGTYVEAKLGATTKKLFISNKFSTTKMICQGQFDLYLSAGNVVTFKGTVVATNPTFGDGTWQSNLQIEKIS